jgi:hypothetical protein
MRRGIAEIRADQLHRIKAAIRRNGGSIRWTVAVVKMRGPGSRGDARFDSMTIKEFVESGSLAQSWDEEGNTLLSLSG